MLPAESGITYALGLLGGRRTFDGGPERLPAGGILAGMFFSSPASKSPLERGGPLAVGCVLFSKDAFSQSFATREERVSFLAPANITSRLSRP